MISLSTFLTDLIQKMNDTGIESCILRNYAGLPHKNTGNDVDFLILNKDVTQAVSIINNMDSITITGYIQRPYVTSVFIYGINWGENNRAIQVDFFTSLSWKGIPYLSSSEVLTSCEYAKDTNNLIKKPAEHHEAIISFFSSYLVGGWIKDKYQDQVIETFNKNRKKISLALDRFLDPKTSKELIDNVIIDNRNKLYALLPKIRRKLFINDFYSTPIRTLNQLCTHYYCEIKIRFTPYARDSICILGSDGSGKSTIISSISQDLRLSTKNIAYIHLKPSLKSLFSNKKKMRVYP